MIDFQIFDEYIPMIQLLKALNWVSTGGHAQIVVEAGEVKYNGSVDYRKRLKVRVGDVVEYNGQSVKIIGK